MFGTMLGICGAMIITFYKGAEINPWTTNINLLKTTVSHPHHSGLDSKSEHGGHKFVVGAILGLVSCVCYSLWLIVQVKNYLLLLLKSALFPCLRCTTEYYTLHIAHCEICNCAVLYRNIVA